jgi:ABC-type multidrug transport system fused ATPase/permease subunit
MNILATDYPLLNVFWTMLGFFLFFIWIWLLITVISDVFRSQDLSGWAKALWLIFMIFLPYLGVFIYLIARGGKMHEHAIRHAESQDAAFRSYVQEAAGGGSRSTADELSKLVDLRDRGVITVEEFERQKTVVLA